jgi:hypothetical protein
MNLWNLFRKKVKSEWHLIGHAPVDAGCVLIIDPCYLRDVLLKDDERVEKWYDQTVVDQIDNAKNQHWPVMASGNNVKIEGIPLGHLIITGRGDGSYPVEIRYNADGTVAEVRIRFGE